MLTSLTCSWLLSSLLAGPSVVKLPLGVTSLTEVGVYSIAYQSYGGETVAMPASWHGNFETVSGIAYLAGEHLLGRDAILLHSPWRVPAGKVWVDYPLQLPVAKPLTFRTGIAMRPDVCAPDKSDGVTFSASLVVNGQARELFREHRDVGEWQDYEFDLSPYAGQTITLRLQTEPGPQNSPSFDFSYFGAPEIACGTTSHRDLGALVAQLTSTKAARAVAGHSLTGLANRSDQGVVPSNLLPCKVGRKQLGEAWEWTYTGADATLVYRYEPRTGTLDDLTVKVDDAAPFSPALGGGFTYDGDRERASGGELLSAQAAGETGLAVRWQFAPDRVVNLTLGINGKALTIQAAGEHPSLVRFSLGGIGAVPLRRTIRVPYLYGALDYLGSEQVYVCRYLDWTKSNASRCPQGTAEYGPKTDGTRNELAETGYLAVSPTVDEVLPNLPHPASPYLELLGPRIMLDIWGHNQGTYEGDAAMLRELKDNGVDHVAIIQHVWQRWGYDVKLPDHLPANPSFGGDAGMKIFGQTARDCGYVWSLHENYIDLYPDAPSYDPTARVLRADGTPSPAWFNKGTQVQSYGLKCNRALGFAQQVAPEAHRRFGTNAAYLDVHTCVPPWHQLDQEANQPLAAMQRAKVKYDSELFAFMRQAHEGPLFGEGHFQMYWAGLVDGVEAQVDGGEDHQPFLDFDLLKLHPQMVNHGMGYYERWFRQGYEHRLGQTSGTPEQVDKYRAQELAYGHAGFIGSSQTSNLQWIAKEHHLMHPVQRLYGEAKATAIDYEVAGELVPASVALACGERLRQRISYDSGLKLWVNWSAEPWTVEGRVLPQWGFLALGPETVAETVLQDGRFADWVDCPEYVFADARTSFNMPYLNAPMDVEPRLKAFKELGGGQFEVTYEWRVGEQLPADQKCFVHFTNPTGQNDGIVFQQDHGLPKPTQDWQPGETLVDGPFTVTVPAEGDPEYDLVIGLFGGPRLRLKGLDDGSQRIWLGRLKVTRENGQVTKVELDLNAKGPLGYKVEPKLDFTAHLNPKGTLVDFGPVATDGSVKIERAKAALTVLPYPREKVFTVKLDVAKVAGVTNLDPNQLRVRALSALEQKDLGNVPHTIENGRLVFKVGLPGAGRYVITW